MTGIRTTCPYCGVGCGVIAAPDGRLGGDPDHPANRGRLCSKGAALAETLVDRDRLLHPSIGGRAAGWDEALDLAAGRFAAAIAEHGPDSVAFYVSGQCLTEDYYVANKLMKGFIGSGNIDTNSRLCMASSVAGHVRAFGEDVVPGTYEDLELADLVVLVGSNLAWCHPILYQRLAAARARRDTRIVVIDPRRTATCDDADLHLPLAPGSDVLLFAGLLSFLAQQGAVAPDWVERHTEGLDAALLTAATEAGTIGRVAHGTGLKRADIERFYTLFAAQERVVTVYSQGVNQAADGTDKVNAIINCHLATGRIGRPGMGPFSVTGQPNAMGGREVGGLANQLAAHMGFDDPADRDRVQRFWRAPRLATRPGLKAIELFEAVHDGRIKALLIMATNPAASLPRGDRVREALGRCPFVVVADCWPTDTTALAHVVLPAAGWGEKDGTVTNSERRISRQRAFRPAPGEARPDWWILAELGRRMGWPEDFAYDRPEQIFREHAALSAFENDGRRAFDLGALDGVDYDSMAPTMWPDEGRLFGDGRFKTPDGRARFVPTPWWAPARAAFVLNTGRTRDQWHTMTRTGQVPRLMTHLEEPLVALHPEDAATLALEPGDLVRVTTDQGSALLRFAASEDQRPGEIFAPMHWTDRFTSAGPIDRLVAAATDPVSGQPALKSTAAALERVACRWQGVVLRRDPRRPEGAAYWARVPLAEGVGYELAGTEPLPRGAALERWIEALLAPPPGAERLEAIDPARGLHRAAYVVEGRLESCVFLSTRQPVARGGTAALLGRTLDPAGRIEVLAGRAPGVRPAAGGRTVCACFSVGLETLSRAIAAGRLTSVAEIGAALRAGTNCGSCIPELRRLLAQASVAA